jgi:hypothetical protein
VAYALSRLDAVPASAVPVLLECVAHPSDGLRLHAALALQAVAEKSVVEDLSALLEDSNMSIRLIAARAVLTIETKQAAALTVVAEALASESAGYRRAALRLVEALEKLPGNCGRSCSSKSPQKRTTNLAMRWFACWLGLIRRRQLRRRSLRALCRLRRSIQRWRAPNKPSAINHYGT